MLDGARFERGDPLYREWRDAGGHLRLQRRGARADPALGPDQPDARPVLMALLARFYGYFPGYSREIVEHHDYLTWAILKAHTDNRAGSVTLRSADPRDTPAVNFRYFEEGDDAAGDDLRAVVDGIRLRARLRQPLNAIASLIAEEELPGAQCRPTRSSPSTCATTPGATTPRAPARSAPREAERRA